MWCEFYHSDILALLVDKCYGLVEWQSAQLVEQHARQHQSVVDLSQSHLGLVHLYVDTQSVATCSHAFVDHLVHIAIKLLDQLQIALCQLFLVVERNHLPVGLVYLIKCGLTTNIGGVLCHLGIDIGHLVGSDDSATHKHRLRHHDGTCKHVAGIGVERIYNFLSHSVQCISNITKALSCHLIDGSARKSHRFQRLKCERGQLRQCLLKTLLHLGANSCSQLWECALLVVAKQTDRFAGVLIRTYSTHVGQILGAGRLANILGHILFKFGNTKLLVVAQGHLSAAIKAEHALSLSWHDGCTKQHYSKNLLHTRLFK